MTRTQKQLLGLLAVQLVLIVLLRSPFSRASGSVALKPLLPALEAFTPARIELFGADEDKVTLIRQGEGWGLDELGGFPADANKVDDLVEKLRGLQVRRPVVSSSRYHEAFKVTDDTNEGRVKLFGDRADDAKVDLLLGTSANYRSLHVRSRGEDPVYEVRDLATYDVRAKPGNWAHMEFVDVPEAELASVVVSNAAGSFELVRGDDGWSAVGSDIVLDQDKVSTLVRSASSLRLAEPLGPVGGGGAEPADPALTVTLRWWTGGAGADEGAEAEAQQELVYWIGDKLADSDTQRYATRTGFDFKGAIWDSSVSNLIEKKLEELAVDEATGS